MKTGGRVHYIESIELPTSSDAVILDSNKTVHMKNKCMKLTTQNYPQNYPANLDVTIDVSFPNDDDNCWNVSMRFQSIFDIPENKGCLKSFVDITLQDETIVNKFCGSKAPENAALSFIQVKKGQMLSIRFRSDDAFDLGRGFMLKICKDECCFENGHSSFWEEWGQWSYPNTCPHQHIHNTNVAKRSRKCKNNCKCSHEDVNIIRNDDFAETPNMSNKCFNVQGFSEVPDYSEITDFRE